MDIIESDESIQKESLLKFKENNEYQPPGKEKDLSQPKVPDNVGTVAVTSLLVTLAVFLRFFVVVDIVTNSFSKINVQLGPRIEKLALFLKDLQFPTIGFTEISSPIDDGGDLATQNHSKFKENQEKEERDRKKNDLIIRKAKQTSFANNMANVSYFFKSFSIICIFLQFIFFYFFRNKFHEKKIYLKIKNYTKKKKLFFILLTYHFKESQIIKNIPNQVFIRLAYV